MTKPASTGLGSLTDEQLYERGNRFALQWKAWQAGVQIPLTAADLDAWSATTDELERRWEAADPIGFANSQRELREQQAQRKTIAAIAYRLERAGVLPSNHQEEAERMAQRVALGLRAYEPPQLESSPLPRKFHPLLKFAASKLHISTTSQLPAIKMTSRGPIECGGVPAGACGTYLETREEIRILDDLDDDSIAATLIHELVHHSQQLKGWGMSEVEAYAEEKRLLKAWRDERHLSKWQDA